MTTEGTYVRADPGLGLGRADCLALGALWVFMAARCLAAGRELMWFDELLSFRLIHDPSVGHMLHALGSQADGAPPAYYLAARAWGIPFSAGPLSLRLFSSAGFCTGITILWWCMRRAFRFLPTALSAALVLGHSQPMAFEALNIRFYGLLFALTCWVAALGFRFSRHEAPGAGLLAANALANACLVLCHPLGVFYGAAVALGVAWSGLACRPRRARVAVLASYAVGWLALLLWIRQFLHQADINNPHGWIPMPSLAALLREWRSDADLFVVAPLVAVLFAALMTTPRGRGAGSARDLVRAPWWPYLPVAAALIGVGPLFWVISRIDPANSIFFPRYLLGTEIGWTVALAGLLSRVLGRLPGRLVPYLWLACAGACLLASRVFWEVPAEVLVGRPPQDERRFLAGASDRWFGHANLAVVCPRSHDFLPRTFYSADAQRYYYLIDWEGATDPRAQPEEVGDFKILSALRRNYPDLANVVPASEFLSRNSAFLVHDIPGSQWLAIHLGSGSYTLTRLAPDRPVEGGLEGEWPMVLVERRR